MDKVNARISSDMERCVSNDVEMFLVSEHEPPLNVNLLIVTEFGKLLIGKMGPDIVEWAPLPRRSTKRKQQKENV